MEINICSWGSIYEQEYFQVQDKDYVVNTQIDHPVIEQEFLSEVETNNKEYYLVECEEEVKNNKTTENHYLYENFEELNNMAKTQKNIITDVPNVPH